MSNVYKQKKGRKKRERETFDRNAEGKKKEGAKERAFMCCELYHCRKEVSSARHHESALRARALLGLLPELRLHRREPPLHH